MPCCSRLTSRFGTRTSPGGIRERNRNNRLRDEIDGQSVRNCSYKIYDFNLLSTSLTFFHLWFTFIYEILSYLALSEVFVLEMELCAISTTHGRQIIGNAQLQCFNLVIFIIQIHIDILQPFYHSPSREYKSRWGYSRVLAASLLWADPLGGARFAKHLPI